MLAAVINGCSGCTSIHSTGSIIKDLFLLIVVIPETTAFSELLSVPFVSTDIPSSDLSCSIL